MPYKDPEYHKKYYEKNRARLLRQVKEYGKTPKAMAYKKGYNWRYSVLNKQYFINYNKLYYLKQKEKKNG